MSEGPKVVGLHGYEPDLKPDETSEDIIRILEDLLKDARTNKFSGIGIVWEQQPGRVVSTAISIGTGHHLELLGGAAILMQRISNRILDPNP